jgi:branched-chain amino acid aminotransferase
MTIPQIIPFDQRTGLIWHNGKLIPWQDAKIHVLTHGLHYGSSVFEGERVYNSKIFKLTEHSKRLINSAELIGFKIPFTVEEIDQATMEVVKAQGIIDGYVRPFAWRGSERIQVSAPNNKIHVAIAAWEWPAHYAQNEARQKGIKMVFGKWRKPLGDSVPYASKAAGLYMTLTMCKHDAEAEGAEDAILLDTRGYIAEATTSNFFMVIGNELHTPLPDCFLNGINRQTVIDLAKENGIKVIERHIKPEELSEGSEAFLTGTAAEIVPIASIDKYQFSERKITELLKKAYKDLVLS